MKQILILYLLLFLYINGSVKLPQETSEKIQEFTLFNYDNLIADAYEKEKPYIKELALILSEATNIPTANYEKILVSHPLITDPSPVKYMLKLNQKTDTISHYYFVNK